MKILIALFFLSFSHASIANLTGNFKSEFKRKSMDCVIESQLQQLNDHSLKFKVWDEYCEDDKGNSYESSLADEMIYEKMKDGNIKVKQGADSVIVKTFLADFSKTKVHYHFEVNTEDGLLDIEESYELKNKYLDFFSVYKLDGEVIIDKSGTLERIK